MTEEEIFENIEAIRVSLLAGLKELQHRLGLPDEAFSAILHAESLSLAWQVGVQLDDVIDAANKSHARISELARKRYLADRAEGHS